MKTKIIIALIALLPLFSLAQKNELFLGLSIGSSVPLGDFSSNAFSVNEEGIFENDGQFAKTGFAFDFSANYRVGYYLGFAGRVMGGTNKVDSETYSKAMNEVIAGSGYETTVSSKGWGNAGVYLGAYVVVPVNDLYIDMRIMGGFLNLYSPEIRFYLYESDVAESELFIRDKYNAGAFSYDLGLGLKYKFSSNKFLLLNGDYIAAHVKKDNIETLNPFTQEEETVNMDIHYQSLTFTIGLGYIL